MLRTFVVVMAVTALLAGAALPALAQDGDPTRSVSITEDQINQSYRVSTTPRYRVDGAHVDLQAGQVVISATITPLRVEGAYDAEVTLVPDVSQGFVAWTVSEAQVNGAAATDKQVLQINTVLTESWRRYMKEQADAITVTDLSITDSDLTLTFVVDPAQIPTQTPGTYTLTEDQINQSYRVSTTPRYRVEDAYVDLQTGQAVIYVTVAALRTGTEYTVTTILVPQVVDGTVLWSATSATVDDASLSADILAQINERIESSWQQYMRRTTDRFTVTGITVSDTAITVTAARNS